MMKCNDDLIQMYVEGTLQPEQAAGVEAHLEACRTCRTRVSLYKGLFWDLGRVDVPADGWEETEMEALARRLQAEWQQGRPSAPARPAALATLWLTANPVARKTGSVLLSALEAAASLGFGTLARTGHLLLRRKGGGRR